MMRTKTQSCAVIASLGLLLLALVLVPHEPILNWWTARSLHKEQDAGKRVVIMNVTRGYAPGYWNREYLLETLRADTKVERQFLADLIHERFNADALRELQGLLRPGLNDVSRSNIVAVIAELERRKN